MSQFESMYLLVERFRDLGAKRIFLKALSENDNSKQQVYLGGSFEVLTFFPHGTVTTHTDVKQPNFKASLNFWWVTPEEAALAPHTQLILYPKYPEVRLSGFLLGCGNAPSKHMQPVPKQQRTGDGGRMLFFGTTEDGRTLACLAPTGTQLASEAIDFKSRQPDIGLFTEIPLAHTVAGNSKQELISALRAIQSRGFVDSVKLDKAGNIAPYKARNGGGYTLEALLGIKPNGRAEPDFEGWEIKAFGSDRITLMTPEPDGGYYGEHGVGAFVRRYGRDVEGKDQRYFTGIHRYQVTNQSTGMQLCISGFESKTKKISNVSGAIQLFDPAGNEAASWSFGALLSHWNRKHAFAAYVPYESGKETNPTYKYGNPVLFGEHTDFSRYLTAITEGHVCFDPGSKIEGTAAGNPKVKARSQFRISRRQLHRLYESFEAQDL